MANGKMANGKWKMVNLPWASKWQMANGKSAPFWDWL
jgi:hypothetical protein